MAQKVNSSVWLGVARTPASPLIGARDSGWPLGCCVAGLRPRIRPFLSIGEGQSGAKCDMRCKGTAAPAMAP